MGPEYNNAPMVGSYEQSFSATIGSNGSITSTLLDDGVIRNAVPEPGSWALGATAFVLLWLGARRYRRPTA
jgi:hypothetical protein